MRTTAALFTLVVLAALLSGLGTSNAVARGNGDERGGAITVGDTTWQLVPAIQCSVYPGNVVNIAGHAASDPALEIVIDYNGPTGVRIGGEGAVSWHAIKDSLKFDIDGKRVQGSATFNTDMFGAGESAPGSFDINCS